MGAVEGLRGNLEKAGEFLNKSLKAENGDNIWVAASLNNLGVVSYSHGDSSKAMKHFEKSWGLTQKSALPDGPREELLKAILENLAKVRLALNLGVDDLLEETEKLSIKIEALEAWRLLKEGHRLASKGRWNEAHELVLRGEKVLGGAPSKFVWISVGMVDEIGS